MLPASPCTVTDVMKRISLPASHRDTALPTNRISGPSHRTPNKLQPRTRKPRPTTKDIHTPARACPGLQTLADPVHRAFFDREWQHWEARAQKRVHTIHCALASKHGDPALTKEGEEERCLAAHRSGSGSQAGWQKRKATGHTQDRAPIGWAPAGESRPKSFASRKRHGTRRRRRRPRAGEVGLREKHNMHPCHTHTGHGRPGEEMVSV
ncbi:hypothetical protein OF83DRAFT_15438 [Amylostereum chailletii]|nr:hypothetical protein OF83DRAFT_15438 [Amylostereum chailletii]